MALGFKMKVTALKPVKMLVNITSEKREQVGSAVGYRTTNRLQWVSLSPGQSVDNVSLIMGFEPSLVPGRNPIPMDDGSFATPVDYNVSPGESAEILDLVRVEKAED